ncbi:hypothetical protein EYC80_000640 [Monilinia laxa]|uniref:adenine phosphoribosyltransferase n=1 Tax=Monilinia laxa TaxID=61186 RepID=A0A5N6KB92_MONLA|nr:hypothetical protein EYC80_000640 [Monilinia laxa]
MASVLFDTEMYMTGMHGGHASGKTSSFKRCFFLKNITEANIANILISAIQKRPSPSCYLHLLQGGGAIDDLSAEATAFGCRNWDFACVITGVWPRDQNGSEMARNAMQWVYNIANELLPICNEVYGADLGPDPRDASLALKAFGPNLERLARLKHDFDPRNVLAYACPLPKPAKKQKLIILVTGCSGAGKDYCADIWVSAIMKHSRGKFTARSVSISDATKREYARATGADLNQLLSNRAYKEQHRSALTKFLQDQVCRRPQLFAEHFQNVAESAAGFDVLFITGMRDKAPVAMFSHLVPGCRVLDIRIETSQTLRYIRQGLDHDDATFNQPAEVNKDIKAQPETLPYRPTYTFNNEGTGEEAADSFAKRHLLPFLHDNLQHLSTMVPTVPDFPRPGIMFLHVLNIAQQPGGLPLCTPLLQNHIDEALAPGTPSPASAIASCEAGGYVFASAVAAHLDIPLLLIRGAGKLPHPLASVVKSASHISFRGAGHAAEERSEMNCGVVGMGSSVVVVDDVFATGRTLCAVIRLLLRAGVCLEHVRVVVVAEFPVHVVANAGEFGSWDLGVDDWRCVISG